MKRRSLSAPARAILMAITLAACAGSAGPSSSTGPSATPGIAHPTGATEVVLRFEEGGGFVPVDFLAGSGPIFTLYGDGTVIFRDLAGPQPDALNGISVMIRYSIARLTEDQVQSLLAFALGEGGLGRASGFYTPGGVADMPVATFTVNADGASKTVSVEALGFENPQSPDLVLLRQLAKVGTRFRSFTASAPGAVPWTPDRYRGILSASNGAAVRAWPWPELTPADFPLMSLPSGRQWNARTMSPAEAAALNVPGSEGGISSMLLSGPDGTSWSFVLRPLLPDEAA